MEKNNRIRSVSEYISFLEINGFISREKKYVFRGETKYYPTTCIPNLFRNKLRDQPRFEKSILEKIRSEGFDNEKSFLLTAIEAQHGGFPSRLLDVSFNALIALFFAVTPHYKSKINANDKDDGVITIINISEMVSPSSEELEELYSNNILNENKVNNVSIISHNHVFVDYHRKNKRIQAQQGAFVLFQGKEFRKIPSHKKTVLYIDKNKKKHIREELDILFGYTNGFVYPEPNNFSDNIPNYAPYFAPRVKFNNEDYIEKYYITVIKEVEFMLDNIIIYFQQKDDYENKIIELERYIINTFLDLDNSEELFDKNESYKVFRDELFREIDELIEDGNLSINYLDIKGEGVTISNSLLLEPYIIRHKNEGEKM